MKSSLILLAMALSLTSTMAHTSKILSPQKTFPFGSDGRTLEGVSKNTIYLTFDDGPTSEATPAILDILKEYNIKATFFVVGRMARAHESILAEIRSQGHRLANHSYNHELSFKSDQDFIDTLNDTHEVIERYMQPGDISLFRAPGGNWKDWQALAANGNASARKYVGPIFWNVGGGNGNAKDDADWKCWKTWWVSARKCGKSYIEQIENNYNRGRASLVLMHDINRKSADMLEYILKKLTSSRSKVQWKFELISNIPAVKENTK